MSTGSDIRQARLQALASADRLASDIARAERPAAAIGRGEVVVCCGRVDGGALLALEPRGHAVARDPADVRTPVDEELDPAAAAVRTALP